MSDEKTPKILDFGKDKIAAIEKVKEILCTTTSGWPKYLIYDPDNDDEVSLLFDLLFEGAVFIAEVCYTPIKDFPGDVRQRAEQCLYRLAKRDADYVLLNAANCFLRHELDLEKSDKMAVFYQGINSYVRCGDLEPVRLFEYLEKDYCESIVIFSGFKPDADNTDEAFYVFGLRAPKEYVLRKLQEMRKRRFEQLADFMNKMEEANNIYPKIRGELT